MTTFFQFALLGLGTGGGYAISGIGLTQIYRGSGVLNLAHGAMAFFAGVLFVYSYQKWGFPLGLAFLFALACSAVIGALIEFLVMRPLRDAAPLVRMIATLGVLAVLQQSVPLIFGSTFSAINVQSYYPDNVLTIGDTIKVPYDRLIVVAVAIVLAVVLRLTMTKTNFGLATTAGAENPLVAATMGVNTNRVALLNWIIGAMLAGLSGVLLVPILGSIVANPLILLIIPTLAASMIGRFNSFSLTVAGGLLIGIGQSLLTRWQGDIFGAKLNSGWPDALPFIIILVFLVAGGTAFPRRGELAAKLPKIGRTHVPPAVGVALSVFAAVLVGFLVTDRQLATTFSTIGGMALVGLSIVVATGLAGQTVLAQLSIAGVAAMVAAALSHAYGWPFLVVLVVGVIAGAVVGVVFAVPAFRTRGPTLAVATLGIGVALQAVVLTNGNLTLSNSYGGTPIKPPSIGGWSLDGFEHPARYAAVVVLVMGLGAVAVSNLRAGPTGRRLMAMRSSERAAAAAGIGLARAKAAAFVVAAALASLGGVLLAFQSNTVTFTQYDVLSSLSLVVFVLIGGVGYVLGPIAAAIIGSGGIFDYIWFGHATVQRWIIGLGGVGLILALVFNPNGQVEPHEKWIAKLLAKRPVKPDKVGQPLAAVRRAALQVRGLTVAYGPVTAVDNLNLTIEPGQIVGLIGPNGAGKTTAIDAISGFTRSRAGKVTLDGADISARSTHSRARAGVGRTFQTVEPFDDLTVAENLAVTLEKVRWWHWVTDLTHRRMVALPASVRDQAASLGLDKLAATPAELSQGQRRALGVLRAIAASPAVLLLDEPAAGLNRAETHHLAATLRKIADEQGIGMLLVEHDVSMVTAICDHVVAIDFGRTIFDGPVADAVNDPSIKSAYLGDVDVDVEATDEAGEMTLENEQV